MVGFTHWPNKHYPATPRAGVRVVSKDPILEQCSRETDTVMWKRAKRAVKRKNKQSIISIFLTVC